MKKLAAIYSLRRKIELPVINGMNESNPNLVMSALYARLKKENPSEISNNAHRIIFSNSFFRIVNSWDLLAPIKSGVIKILPANKKLIISYELWFTDLFITATVATVVFGGFMLSSGVALLHFGIMVGAWILLYGLNFLIAALRFHGLVRSAIKNCSNEEKY